MHATSYLLGAILLIGGEPKTATLAGLFGLWMPRESRSPCPHRHRHGGARGSAKGSSVRAVTAIARGCSQRQRRAF